VKEDIISFAYMGQSLNSRQLRVLSKRAPKNVQVPLSTMEPSLNTLRQHTWETLRGQHSHPVVQSLLTPKNIPFFRKFVLNDSGEGEKEDKEIDFGGEVGKEKMENREETDEESASPRYRSDKRDEFASEVIEKAHDMYVEDTKPLIMSKRYKELDLLEQFYKLETAQGAKTNCSDSAMNQIIREFCILHGKDPKNLKLGKSAMHEAIHNRLEEILLSNKSKTNNVVIDKRFAGLGSGDQSLDESLPIEDQHRALWMKPAEEDSNKLEGRKTDEKSNCSSIKPEMEINLPSPTKVKKINFIRKNMIAVMDKKSVIRLLDKFNTPLVTQNIPYISHETGFSRAELHTFYTLYKALCHATSQRYGIMKYDVSDGIDDKIFRKGVYQVFIQNDVLAEKIFGTIDYNFSRFMNWPEFISGMQMIKAKTLADKIGLFIKVKRRVKLVS
jgi:hypothetical protein